GVCNTVDPLAGSFYIEDLTDRIERDASALIDKIDHMGGMIAAIEAGEIQRQIEESAFQYQQQIDREERSVVGVNCFREQEPVPQGIFKLDTSVEENQKRRLAGVRASRDNHAVKTALARLGEAARGKENLMPLILDAVRCYASVGDICDVLRGVFGKYEEKGLRLNCADPTGL
ncbi:MAG: methylmalonyl-CoA mutase family protein, partial [Planctomycetota bacterium]